MNTFHYTAHGVCSRGIDIELDGERVVSVRFQGGWSGNTQGVAALVAGMTVTEAIRRLSGIRCGMRPTSCPDQLSKALAAALAKEKQQTV